MSEEVRCSHLLVKHNESRNPVSRRTGEKISRTKGEAREILASFELTPDNFAQLAKEHSDCSSFKQGGDLGFFGHGAMQQPFEDASFSLRVGEMSDIVSTDSGLHRILRTG